ncbi:DUF6790 family protein [Marinibaculum pumilum]|uniref:DUF6790 family protein n=1 Tax=Marinibaculum pumilum TaxID=1766165 RepID=A0ABV7KYC3_9PROT
MIESLIFLVLSNFTLVMLLLGLLFSLVAIAMQPAPRSAAMVVDALAAWFFLFSIGVSYLYNFVIHVFFGEMAAKFIGWADSPFQLEVGFASLGFAALGFIAFRGAFAYRVAAVVAVTCFLWGAAGGHVYQMVAHDNYAPGNAGVVFFTDIGVPLIGLVLLWLLYRTGHGARVPQARPA